jgi:hypothetical protein
MLGRLITDLLPGSKCGGDCLLLHLTTTCAPRTVAIAEIVFDRWRARIISPILRAPLFKIFPF